VFRRAWLRLLRSAERDRAVSSDRAAEERLLELEAQVGAALKAYAESGDHPGLRVTLQDLQGEVRTLRCANPAWDTARLMMARWLDSLATIAVAPHHQTDEAYEKMKARHRAFEKALMATGDVTSVPPEVEPD
jgi:hypothetical protein